MQRLPVEIWRGIVVFLDASSQITHRMIAGRGSKAAFSIVSRTLKSLSLTSHALQMICQPLLFSKVTFGEKGKRDSILHLHAIECILDSKPEAASWIEEASLCLSTDDMGLRRTVAEATANILVRLSKLEKVVIHKSFIDDALYWTLFSIPSLRKLAISYTHFKIDTVERRQGPWVCPVTSISAISMPMVVPGSVEESLHQLIFASRLRTLTLRSPGGSVTMYDLYKKNVVCCSLLDLDMEEPRDAQLSAFITAAGMFPNLSTLVFTRTSGPVENAWTDVPLYLDESVFPKLSRFSGAIKLARWIVPGRPIVSVRIPERELCEIWLDSTLLKPFRLTKANLVNLTLGRCVGNVAWFVCIAKALPNLEVLILQLRRYLIRVSIKLPFITM